MYRYILWLRNTENQLWVKPAIGSVFAIAFALLATLGGQFLSEDALPEIERDTLDGLLTVVASSMLAVTTFSLSIMVSAFASASAAASPRATALVVGDQHAHTAIASFISAFIYSIIAKTALGIQYYGPAGRFILFLSTLAVIIFLIYTLIRWVRTMSSLGRMGNTIEKIEAAAATAMQVYRELPTMGATLHAPAQPSGQLIRASEVAYVRHIDIETLQAIAVEGNTRLHVRARPGMLVDPGTVLVCAEGQGEVDVERIRKAFVLGPARTFDQDPRFGLIVLSEVAQRALSPAVNDPGTAIAVMNSMARVLVHTKSDRPAAPPLEFDRLSMIAIDEADFIVHGFDPIARDGASLMEIGVRMQKLLATIANHGVLAQRDAARSQAAMALRRAQRALSLDEDKQRLARLHEQLHPTPSAGS
jgi:uncharacterized membrane protein